jgi:hypothetical protein
MVFEFSVQRTYNESIDVVDIGNTALKCLNGNMETFYLVTKTVMGKTHILKFGPVCPDIDVLINDFFVNYKKIDYKENLICKEIDKFINDYKKEVDTIEEVTEFEMWQDFPDIKQLFDDISGVF